MSTTARPAVPNAALYNLRDAAGLTQRELADALNEMAAEFGEAPTVDANHVSRWERGIIARPRPTHQRMLARILGVSIEELGFTRPRHAAAQSSTGDLLDLAKINGRPVLHDPAVEQSQDEWRSVRRHLNRTRQALAETARQLYPDAVQLDATGLIAPSGWVLDHPIDLDQVTVSEDFAAEGPTLTGAEPESGAVRPLATVLNRFPRYSHAVRQVEHPTLFENRLSYRLLSYDTTGSAPAMTYGLTTYFDMVDVCEAAAHELAATHLSGRGDAPLPASWTRLKFRRLIGDPFDLTRRPVLPSTDTLTIRASRDGAAFVLHQRDSSKVALAGGQLHVMPAGVFQPSSIYPAAQHVDLDLWRNIEREFSEEFLGNPEHNGDGLPADYDAEPLRAFEQARRAGRIRVHYLGLALDAVTLAGEILTVAVFDGPTYDALFAGIVDENTEGEVLTTGTAHPTPLIPFAEPIVRQLLDDNRLAPAAAGCLQLAWQHRHQILDL